MCIDAVVYLNTGRLLLPPPPPPLQPPLQPPPLLLLLLPLPLVVVSRA